MKARLFRIESITNLHAGSGDANYGVVDNLVQRDVVTGLPTIHGSGIKGALREHFEQLWGEKDQKIKTVFGDEEASGTYRFTSAMLLAIPLRSNKKAYFTATAPFVVSDAIDYAANLGVSLDEAILGDLKKLSALNVQKPIIQEDFDSDLLIEDFNRFDKKEIILDPKTCWLLGIMDNNLVIMSEEDFKLATDDMHLPVIARNHLENGISKNLWYEQVVPRRTIFISAILYPETDKLIDDFIKELEAKPVHIGGNASVGYGFTRFNTI